jgi:hypothetical protein
MKVIQANCRVQFTPEDVRWVVETLSRAETDSASLASLLRDPASLDLLLDDERLLRALLDDHACLRVSPHFYFYVLVRHVLRRAGVEDREVADYLAELLAEFSAADRMRCRVPGSEVSLDYFFEMLAALQTVDDRTAFCLRTQIGNQSLFLAGLFPERIRHRAETRGFPDMSYYEQLGQSNFRVAGDHRLARRYSLDGVFHTLSEQFEAARKALNDLADRMLFLGDARFTGIRP